MRLPCLLAPALVVAMLVSASAEEQKVPVEIETLVTGLTNPAGLAVQPGDANQLRLYVSDSGALRVVSIDPKHPAELKEVITGFPKGIYGQDLAYDAGPLGLAFINRNTLVVGGGGLSADEKLVRVYTLPEEGKALQAGDMKAALGPLDASDKVAKGEANFHAIAVADDSIYVTCQGDDSQGWIAKAELQGDTPRKLQPFIATQEATGIDTPAGITINRRGHIVVGQLGQIDTPHDSRLTFYNPQTGKLLLSLETGLFDIVALAYSPSGRLYALDFAEMDPKQGGLFRLDDDGNGGVATVKVAPLDKPTAMAFTLDGTLYVTLFGTAEDGSTKESGKVLKITGKL